MSKDTDLLTILDGILPNKNITLGKVYSDPYAFAFRSIDEDSAITKVNTYYIKIPSTTIQLMFNIYHLVKDISSLLDRSIPGFDSWFDIRHGLSNGDSLLKNLLSLNQVSDILNVDLYTDSIYRFNKNGQLLNVNNGLIYNDQYTNDPIRIKILVPALKKLIKLKLIESTVPESLLDNLNFTEQ